MGPEKHAILIPRGSRVFWYAGFVGASDKGYTSYYA